MGVSGHMRINRITHIYEIKIKLYCKLKFGKTLNDKYDIEFG